MKSAQTAVVTPTLTQRWKAIRPLVMVFFFSLSVMIATALIPRNEADYSSLSPSNPGNSGSQALADAMRHHGVKVIHIHSIQELVARSTPETPAVITDPEDLTTTTAQKLDDQLQRAVYLLQRPSTDFEPLHITTNYEKKSYNPDTLTAQCELKSARAAKQIENPNGQLINTTESGWTKCFPSNGAYAYLEKSEGNYFRAVFADSEIATNGNIDQEGNASMLINAMAQKPVILWYNANYSDSLDEPDTASLTPSWFLPMVMMLGAGITVIGISRGQRMGRLVPEDLPSYVPSSETTRGRGRLMATQNEHGHAARLLRVEAATNIARHLGIDPQATRETLEHALEARGLLNSHVTALLWGPPPTSNAELVTLAEQLTALTQEIDYR